MFTHADCRVTIFFYSSLKYGIETISNIFASKCFFYFYKSPLILYLVIRILICLIYHYVSMHLPILRYLRF